MVVTHNHPLWFVNVVLLSPASSVIVGILWKVEVMVIEHRDKVHIKLTELVEKDPQGGCAVITIQRGHSPWGTAEVTRGSEAALVPLTSQGPGRACLAEVPVPASVPASSSYLHAQHLQLIEGTSTCIGCRARPHRNFIRHVEYAHEDQPFGEAVSNEVDLDTALQELNNEGKSYNPTYDQRDMRRLDRIQEVKRRFRFFSLVGYMVILASTWEYDLWRHEYAIQEARC
ncbi:hypothetical protein LTR17_024621 [Elasticomyces elasticus]|nr:hypothetical protein LTR17_024621 [Elasticomyces elasticus]